MPDVRLIDANALRGRLIEGDGHDDDRFTEGFNFATQVYREYIDDAPTIDAQPVKHGKWVRDASGELNCSYCGYAPKWDDDKFCANCGAKMDGGDADETE